MMECETPALRYNAAMIRVRYIIAAIVLAAAPALGDSIAGISAVYSGNVLGLRNGKIEIEDARQNVTRISPDVAGPISLTAHPKVLDAELAYQNHQMKSAITLYAEALRDIDDDALQQLVQARQERALDADGQLVEATRTFLRLYAASPTAGIAALRPSNLPEAGSKALPQAAELVEQAVTAGGKTMTAAQVRPLKMYLLDLYLKAEDGRSAALARELAGGNVAPAATHPAADSAAQTLLASARAMEGQAKFDDACLAYLTLAAQYPKDSAAPTALLAAARVQRDQRHQPEEASRLAQRILETYPNSPEALAAKGMVP